MNRAPRLFVVASAIVTMVGLTFASCEGPAGPQGGAGPQVPVLVETINVYGDTEFEMDRGLSFRLVAGAYPDDATVRTLLWEIYDVASSRLISLSDDEPSVAPEAGFPMLTGNSVYVTALAGGDARILVTAMGAGAAPVNSIITVTVVDVAQQVSVLHSRNENNDLPAVATIYTVVPNEPIRPQLLYFGGNPITITLVARTPGDVLTLESSGSMFTVGEGVILRLGNITLRGMAGNSGGALLAVDDGGVLYMENALSRIEGNANTAFSTGMNPNFPNQGGGVRVADGGTFNMSAGTIAGNSAAWGGGVLNLGSFNMTGGAIVGNILPPPVSGSGINPSGGGVANINGTFNMQSLDASIRANEAVIGGGVWNNGDFNMYAGEIHGNLAREGAGINNNIGGTVNMHGEAVIHGNIASFGGGGVINISRGSAPGAAPQFPAVFNMLAGAVIRDNDAGSGGGVLNALPGAIFNMRGGEIRNNVAAGLYTFGGVSTSVGGGVENFGGRFFMSDGVIFGTDAPEFANTAPEGAAFYAGNANGFAQVSQFGTFDDDDEFIQADPRDVLETTDYTVRVEDGELAD